MTDASLLRRIERVERGDGFAVIVVATVPMTELPGVPGFITPETAEEQGLQTNLPNLPELGSSALGGGQARLRVSFPAAGAVRLRIGPEEDLGILTGPVAEIPFSVAETGSEVTFSTGELTLRLARRPFAFKLEAGGRTVLRSGGERRQVAGFPLAAALSTSEFGTGFSLQLGPGEPLYGFGEDFGRLDKGGRILELKNQDALGSGNGRAYKWVPVFHTGRATVFVHSSGPLQVDAGATAPELVRVDVEGPTLDLFLFAGGDLPTRLSHYTELTGRPRLPPLWAFGLWMSRCRYRTRAELEAAADGMREHGVPCDVLHIDPDWLELDKLNCDFIWSERKYPDPAGMFRELAAKGFQVSIWELPYIDSASPVYEEAKSRGFLVRRADGTPAAADKMGGDRRPRGLVDFSNPGAREWWKQKHASLLAMGAAVFKTDFGEGLPEDAVMADGRGGRAWRNLYPLWYNRTVHEAIEEQTGRRGLVWGRSGWAGSQRFPAQWGGDPESSLAGMAATLRGGLSYALSAPGLWSHDIGGFYGHGPSPELYVRWAQFGCLSPFARAHGLSPREPWEFGERALAITREFVKLRYRLLPYLVSCALEAERFGRPVLRPLAYSFPNDPGAARVDLQYMLGPELLVCPVFSESPDPVAVRFYLPPGRWVDYWSEEEVEGARWLEQTVPLERLPLYVRAGACLPFGPDVQHTGELGPDRRWTLRRFGSRPRPTVIQTPEGEETL